MQIFGIYLMFSCFFVFGKKVSANENQNAAPIITYYRLNGNDITIQWKAPDGVSYSKVDIYSATSPNGSYRYEKYRIWQFLYKHLCCKKVFLIITNRSFL